MDIFSLVLIVAGLIVFETITSIDNAIINAEVLSTMQEKARKWFLVWGLFFAVFVVRGLLPWVIVWMTAPELGPIGALTATFSSDPHILEIIEQSKPVLLCGGGIFLVFLFLHWFFMEKKHYAFSFEKNIMKYKAWFYAVVSLFLLLIVWKALQINPMIAFAAVVGSTAFFITLGFKENAEHQEQSLINHHLSDISKIVYLEIIDMTFSIDGVLGAFAFTISVPLILVGNGIGAFVVRELTIGNIERIKKYIYLKNGAMYSILVLGAIMVMEGFQFHIPSWLSPICTFMVIGYFFYRSNQYVKLDSQS